MNLLIERLPQLLALKERWEPVVGYEEFYAVSNTGRVRSFDRIDALGHRHKGQELKPGRMKSGYLLVTLYRDGKKKSLSVHRMVAEAFRGEIPEDLVVRHITDDPDLNLIPLLEIGTQKENVADRVRNGRDRNASKTHCPRGHDITSPLNLVPASLKRGQRVCLACGRAYNRNRKLGLAKDSPEFKDLADEFYRAILAGFTSPSKFYSAVAATVTR